MDNHPIPQDVTGFQFRLIGNMTVKQFVYVAVGAVGAVIIFYIPIFALIKIILIPLFIIAGVALAFLPIEGRPVDVMTTHFLKALFSPNQFLYHKTGGHLMLSTIHIDQKAVQASTQTGNNAQQILTQEQRQLQRKQQLSDYLTSIHQTQEADEQEANKISALFGPTSQTSVPMTMPTPVTRQETVAQPQVQPIPVQPEVAALQPVIQATTQVAPVEISATSTPEVVATPQSSETATPDADTLIKMQKDTEKIEEDELLIQKAEAELTRAKAEEESASGTDTQSAHAKALEMEQKLKALMDAKQELEKELQALKADQTKRVISTPAVATVPVQPKAEASPVVVPTSAEQPSENIVTKPAPSATADFPSLPDFPNILLGVVKDSSGNVLPHILVDVKDKDDNPVRAFKTNQLGQFLSATPLKEGTYTIHLEDAKNQYKFDVYTVTVNNQILAPLVVTAHDLREELRKSLFA